MTKIQGRFSRILVIPDVHCPYHHIDAFKFLSLLYTEYSPDIVISLGDELDQSQISFHDKDPDAMFSPSGELEESIKYFSNLFEITENIYFCNSNHGSLVYRRAKWSGLPKSVLRSWSDILQAPKGYSWHDSIVVTMKNGHDVLFQHQLTANAIIGAQRRCTNLVIGHHHTKFAVQYWGTNSEMKFAVNAGCLVDFENSTFDYARLQALRPTIGAVVIIDGVPILHPMKLDKKGRWLKRL